MMAGRNARVYLIAGFAMLLLAVLTGVPGQGAYAGLPTKQDTQAKNAHERALQALDEESNPGSPSARTRVNTGSFASLLRHSPDSPEAWLDRAPMPTGVQRNAVASDGTFI